MKAITVAQEGAAPVVADIDETRVPGAGEVLVRVQASSINPLDGGIAAGMLAGMIPHEYPITLGRDFAGVVEQVGNGVISIAVGDEVFGEIPGMADPVHDGAWTERIVVSEQVLAKKPADVDTAQAGAAPLVSLTALATIDALKLSAGQTVLVVGATGGVGSIVVQLARLPAPPSSPRASPRTSSSCVASASTRCSRARATSSTRSASAIPTGWTRWWTRSRRTSPPPTTGS
jgi:NADPH2:quinone reductase